MSNTSWMMALDPCQRCGSRMDLTLINWRFPINRDRSNLPVVIDAINIPGQICSKFNCGLRWIPKNIMDQVYHRALHHHLISYSPKLAERLMIKLVNFDEK